MNIKDEIEKYADEKDRKILHWLLERNTWEAEWSMVTNCKWVTDHLSPAWPVVQTRCWSPSARGLALYFSVHLADALDKVLAYGLTWEDDDGWEFPTAVATDAQELLDDYRARMTPPTKAEPT